MTWYTTWWQEVASTTIGCRCSSDENGNGKRTWSRASDGTWIHECGTPSIATLRSQDMLNLFRGGEHHNVIMTTEELCKPGKHTGWLQDYRWTPERVTGSASGTEARVWVHTSLYTDDLMMVR